MCFASLFQKTLVDVTLENTDIREQIRNLKHTHEQSMEKLREKQKQLETAQIENQLLKLKVQYIIPPKHSKSIRSILDEFLSSICKGLFIHHASLIPLSYCFPVN